MTSITLTLAVARRVNYVAVLVFDRLRIFDVLRFKVTSDVRLALRLTKLARFYGAERFIIEADAGSRLGPGTTLTPTTVYDTATIRRSILPSFTHGDLDRLNRVLVERYPELTRFVQVSRTSRVPTGHRPEHAAVLAAVALGLADALLRRDD